MTDINNKDDELLEGELPPALKAAIEKKKAKGMKNDDSEESDDGEEEKMVKEKKQAKVKAEAAKQGVTGDQLKEVAAKTGSGDKAATLDDVVKSLNALNTKMGQLIDVNDAGHKASAKAAKSGSANLYNK